MSVDRFSRRDLLKVGFSAAALALMPRPLMARFGGPEWEPVPPIQDPKIKELAMRAITASRAAGATYADVRLTHTWERSTGGGDTFGDSETLDVGVRALVDGYWGFASSTVWTPEEMNRLAQSAVQQAKVNSLGKPRPVDWVPAPAVADGHWIMPVKRDPFEVSWGEIQDVTKGMEDYGTRRFNFGMVTCLAEFVRQDRAFASTDGTYCTQRVYRSGGIYAARKESPLGGGGSEEIFLGLDFLSPAGVGWELFTDHQPLEDEIRRLAEEIKAEAKLPVVGVEVGRYDTVMDTRNVADLLSGTFGRATQIDRALGYEANANGTSYLDDPLGMVGTYKAGADLLSVTANRSDRGGCATVQWDDEGVQPETFPLIQQGTLTDFQTTREGAGWLKPAYTKLQRPVRSHGCSVAPTGWDAPMLHTPNLVLEPGKEAQDFEAMVGTLKTGIAVKAAHTLLETLSRMDFQCRNGTAQGRLYMVKNGRRVARINAHGGLLFRTQNFWDGLLALGDASSARRHGMPATTGPYLRLTNWDSESKGEPPQYAYHSVTAPPALFKQVTLIDLTRQP